MEKLIKNGLSSAQLKYIAVLSMLIDHIAVVLLNPVSITYWVSRFIGRLAFPIFVFLMVEGFRKTSNRLNYIKRIFIFAIISEVPFDLAFFRLFDFTHQNVLFNLGIGAVMLFIIEKYKKKTYVKYVALIVAAVVAWATRTMDILAFYWRQSFTIFDSQCNRLCVAALFYCQSRQQFLPLDRYFYTMGREEDN